MASPPMVEEFKPLGDGEKEDTEVWLYPELSTPHVL